MWSVTLDDCNLHIKILGSSIMIVLLFIVQARVATIVNHIVTGL
jgi:hypothetical protein